MSRAAAVPAESDAAIQERTREFELLCACAGVELSTDRRERIAHASSGVDWQEMLRLAEHHGVLPLLARNLPAHGREIPAEIERSLRAAFETNARRSLWFSSELVRITEHFRQRGVKTVPYKGALLAESAYGDVALRSFGDLDFLISPSDFYRGKQALLELGYRPSRDLAPRVEKHWLRTGYELSFDGAAGKYLVELQWRLLPRFYAVDLRSEDLLERAETIVFAGRAMLCLAPEDLLLALCLHAAKHLWMRLIWVCDIAETIRTQKINYAQVAQRARQLGVVRILAVSFWLARNLLRAEVPEGAAATLGEDREAAVLGQQFAARLSRCATYDFESTEYFRWILRLRERRADQARYVWRLALTPSPGDLEAVNLPESLSPVYRVIRLLRLTRKFTSR